jgi:modulator of FtsH protease
MPGQGVGGASIEILVIAILMSGLLGYIHIRAPRRALGVTTANFILRVVGDHLGPLFLIIGAVTLLIGNGGGLYWVVPALIAAMVAAIIGAWVMLVEIVR